MSKKLSYMDDKNILKENFFARLFSVPAIMSIFKRNPNLKQIIKKDPEMNKHVSSINKNFDNIEDLLYNITGEKVELEKFSIKDFIR